jgi:Carboxypeptidase regulatory-like domain
MLQHNVHSFDESLHQCRERWILGAVLLLLVPIAFGQVGTASLSGTVTDATGAVVPNAEVTLHSTQGAFTRTVGAGSDGLYVLASLQPGSYELAVHATGFQDYKSGGIELSSGQAATLNVNVVVAGASVEMTVQAVAPVMQTTSASLGTTVNSRQLNSLPLLGGSFLNALTVAPATVPVSPPGTTYNYSPVNQNVMPSVFGQRQKDNDFLMDGVENRDPDFLGVAMYPPPAAIAEMKVDSGVGSSVYGHGSGATVNVVTKSGSDQWHGDAWEFLRNNVLEARSFFVPSLGPYRWNQFGGAMGGPLSIPHVLKRSSAWYVFGYYEGVRIRTASNYTAFLPTAANLAGNLSGLAQIYDPFSTATGANGAQVRNPYPGNVIPTSQLNASSQAIANLLFPSPNLPAGLIPGVNYLNPGAASQNGDQWSGRTDHQFGQHDNFFARYTGANDPSRSVGLPALTTVTQVRVDNAAISDTHVISSSFVVTGRYGLQKTLYHPNTLFPSQLPEASGFNDTFGVVDGHAALPAITIPGYAGASFGVNNNYALQNSFSGDAQKVAGEHTIEFGGSIIHTHFHDVDNSYTNTVFASTETSNFTSSTGAALGSYLLGVPDSAQRLIGTDQDNQATTGYGAYVQDTWRHRRLTLNIGVRYDYATVPVNADGLGTFDTATGQYVWDITNPITNAPANIQRGGIPPERRDFAPRLGIAYALTPRTVIRSSYGIFFNTFGSQYIQGPQGARGNWPFAFPQSLTGLNQGVPTALLPDPFSGNPATTPYYQQVLNVDKNSSRTPYVHEWTYSLQRQLGHDFAIEAAYFGSRGVKLCSQIIDNTAIIPGPGAIQSRQLFPQLAPYIMTNYDEFSSWYEAGSLQLRKHFSHGLQFSVNFTHSKNLNLVDNLSNGGLGGAPTSNPTRFDARKGDAGFDVPNLLVASWTWQIPGRTGNRYLDAVVAHWTASGIVNYRSGLPFMLFLTTDNENIGTVSGRSAEFPELVGNPYDVQPTVRKWFDTSAFAVPARYTIGDVGRNILRTSTLSSTDFSLAKTWPVFETRAVELRGEFFNVFNHANFGYPGTQIGTAQFGAVSSTLNPGRQVQLAAKIHF